MLYYFECLNKLIQYLCHIQSPFTLSFVKGGRIGASTGSARTIRHTPIHFRGSLLLFSIVFLLTILASFSSVALAAEPTTEVRLVKYASDATTVMAEKTINYEWMESNLPVYGDGITHYYHQGPVFEGDMWDPSETANLKDKGPVKGTAVRDLCDLIGGMLAGDEIMLVSPDGYHVEFAYENVYEPLPQQGTITVCWFKGQDSNYDSGYPGKDGYNSAMQIVFMAGTTNPEGKYVFGNADMRICLPQEEYQHFYDGYASTNGLSGKWISEVRIYSGEAPIDPTVDLAQTTNEQSSKDVPWVPITVGSAGLVLAGSAIFVWKRK